MSVPLNPEVLRYEAAIRGLSGRALARTAKVSDATVSTAYAGKPISMTSALLIARALETTAVDEGLRRLLGKDCPASDVESEPAAAEVPSIHRP